MTVQSSTTAAFTFLTPPPPPVAMEIISSPPVVVPTESDTTSITRRSSDLSTDLLTDKDIQKTVDPSKSLIHQLHLDQNNADYSVRRPWIVGHRGALYDELENTREGFRHCASIGCDAVELDVFTLDDGSLVVFHGAGNDRNPGRLWEYCRVPGTILDRKTFAETQDLRFDPNYPEFVCPREKIERGRIPLFEDVLKDAQETGLHLKIELKGQNTARPTLELVEKYGMISQCSFSSFELSRLAELRELRPQRDPLTGRHVYQTGALFDGVPPHDYLRRAIDVGADEVHLRYDQCTPERIASIHALGMGSMAWMCGPITMSQETTSKYLDIGNEDESCYQAVLRTGVQQVCVNKPNVLIDMMRRRNEMPGTFEFASTTTAMHTTALDGFNPAVPDMSGRANLIPVAN